MYALSAPPAVQPLYALGMALLYALLVAVTRTWLLERRYRVGCCGWPCAAACDCLHGRLTVVRYALLVAVTRTWLLERRYRVRYCCCWACAWLVLGGCMLAVVARMAGHMLLLRCGLLRWLACLGLPSRHTVVPRIIRTTHAL